MSEMAKMQVRELIGPALDWAVAKCGDVKIERFKEAPRSLFIDPGFTKYKPSTDWAQGGPIIERERIELRHDGRMSWCAWSSERGSVHGPTPLIAAMRCYVAAILGETIEVPKELLP